MGGRHHQAGPGDFLTIPPRALHAFRVVSESARFLHISIGAGATRAFLDYAAASPEAPDFTDIDAVLGLLEVNARHGVEVVLPEAG